MRCRMTGWWSYCTSIADCEAAAIPLHVLNMASCIGNKLVNDAIGGVASNGIRPAVSRETASGEPTLWPSATQPGPAAVTSLTVPTPTMENAMR